MKSRLFKLTLVALLMLAAIFALTPQAVKAATEPASCSNKSSFTKTFYTSIPGNYKTEHWQWQSTTPQSSGLNTDYYHNYKVITSQFERYVLKWQAVSYIKKYCGTYYPPNPIDCTEVIGDTYDPKCPQ